MINKLVKGTHKSLSKLISAQYHEKVIDHYQNPRNVGSLDKSKKNVGTGLVGAPACGDVMKLQIQLDQKGQTISNAVFKVNIIVMLDFRMWLSHCIEFLYY